MFGNYNNPYSNNPYGVPYQPQINQQPMQTQQMQTQSMQNNSIIWVQGEAGAKGYLMTPNTSLQLMDSEGEYFYIKTTNGAGMPTLKKYSYTEVTEDSPKTVSNAPKSDFVFDPNKYITREEFNEEMAKIKLKSEDTKQSKKEVTNNGK